MLIQELLGLLEEDNSASVDKVFQRLVDNAETLNNYDEGDEKSLRTDIDHKLKKGWTESEIYSHLRWSEYFDTVTDEDVALRKMKETRDKAEARLKAAK